MKFRYQNQAKVEPRYQDLQDLAAPQNYWLKMDRREIAVDAILGSFASNTSKSEVLVSNSSIQKQKLSLLGFCS